MKILYTTRRAIAMIELIFAIVILGIVMMSAPMLISQASSGSITSLQQEAISAASSELGMILTRQWDEQDTNESLRAPSLVVNNGHGDLNESVDSDGNLTGRRVGTPLLSARTFLTAIKLDPATMPMVNADGRLIATPATSFTVEGDEDDVDDFDGKTITLAPESAAQATDAQTGDYADTTLQLAIAVNYLPDSPNGGTITNYQNTSLTYSSPFGATVTGTTNIKHVSIRATSAGNDTTLHTDIRLHAFTCNIGSYKLKEGRF